ncbi:hypothetical protein [Pseudomonas psychrophila]|uniref:Uncharacterized protein n=1 Tax=Pseudomonas psychrophila TaxID=122355 RepID=A0ABY0VES8_9PSED|nr:hypothetical protein [Pseudomonas psychrophila]KAB0488877.1 hypothetical protein F7Q95_17385 [Pseudomonas psychrophila]KMM97971.1 hypothetical protein TU76_18250 [Pseudomonas psychrophila]QIE31109.1 hypothetical protein G5J76_02130 [Pseudomonas psychrophila]WVI97652.1 hypothetical protein VR624_23360 [Pseudomonas psychrophila]SDU15812.1 hypothetical protein SAMN04490201_0444 [Pseudomonas psychrophila]
MKYRVWLFVMFMAVEVRAEAFSNPLNRATCLTLNREVNSYIRRGIDQPLAEVTVFRQTRSLLIEGFEAGQYSIDQLAAGLYALSQGAQKVVKNCQRKRSRKFVDMLPEPVKTLLLTGRPDTTDSRRPTAFQGLADKGR